MQLGPALAANAARVLRAARVPGVVNATCTLDTVAVICERGLDDAASDAIARTVQRLVSGMTPEAVRGREHVIPVCYDAECGPDLASVAAARGLTTQQVVDLHSQSVYRAGFVGFSPGFAYLQGLHERLHMPRLATPRARVEPGSVAIAGAQSAVYPRATPGGWNVLGRTPLRMYDEQREPPALIEAGDVVRFAPISRAEFDAIARDQPVARAPSVHDAVLSVAHPGTFVTVQPGGAAHLRHAGVPDGGPADRLSAVVANRLVGNADDAAVLEATLSGPTLRAMRDVTLAVCGADAAVVVEQPSGRLVEMQAMTPVSLQPGESLRVHGYRAGARLYVAVGGGVTGPVQPLRAGDVLATRTAQMGTVTRSSQALARFHHDCISARVLRVTLHPHASIVPDCAARLQDALWKVTPRGDRVGVRLEGPALTHAVTTMASHVTLPGDIELTPDGGAIVLGPDAPVTGGYPVLASVIDADQCAMMQARAGEWVRFVVVSLSEARAASVERASALDALTGGAR